MILLVSGSFAQVNLGIERLRAVFEVLETSYCVSEDESVQVYICVKLPVAELANPTIDTFFN